MAIYLKEKTKFTKQQLLEAGKKLRQFLNEAEKLNEKISEYNVSKDYPFEDYLEVYTKDLKEALGTITREIGKLELDIVLGDRK
jgi:hypothetical protein